MSAIMAQNNFASEMVNQLALLPIITNAPSNTDQNENSPPESASMQQQSTKYVRFQQSTVNLDMSFLNDEKKEFEALIYGKTHSVLEDECANQECEGSAYLQTTDPDQTTAIHNIPCDPMQRIQSILSIYDKLRRHGGQNWHKISMAEILPMEQYGHQQLLNDFLHLHKVHCARAESRRSICSMFQTQMPCEALCLSWRRHNRDRNTENEMQQFHLPQNESIGVKRSRSGIINEKDVVFQQEMDKIHGYSLHSVDSDMGNAAILRRRHSVHSRKLDRNSGIQHQFTRNSARLSQPIESMADPILLPRLRTQHKWSNQPDHLVATTSDPISVSSLSNITYSGYIGQKEDVQWLKKSLGSKLNLLNVESVETPERRLEPYQDVLYQRLVDGMGMFMWQSAHEALNNPYAPLSTDSWNQTLRKSKLFLQSWAGKRMRTKYVSYFDDQITGNSAKWQDGAELTRADVVVLKMYTDFDELQFEIKQCFRLETLESGGNHMDTFHNHIQWKEHEERIEVFFHWRASLMIALNKFGTRWRDMDNAENLYTGINRKMGISSTATFSFYGPLSTTTSEHVAKEFATDKGMVLQIASRFPRSNYCNAFHAISISDYPQEQEWLIGFMYVFEIPSHFNAVLSTLCSDVRVLKVITESVPRETNKELCADLLEAMPVVSQMRESFFVLQLFKEQVFAMDEQLERWLALGLAANRRECCVNKRRYTSKYGVMDMPDWEFLLDAIHYLEAKHDTINMRKYEQQLKTKLNALSDDQQRDIKEAFSLRTVWWQQFNKIRECPNKRHCVKFDQISDNLKRFFMERTDELDPVTNQRKWSISFKEIAHVYPNVEELHFINEHRFDDGVLQRLIRQIQRSHEASKLRKVVFLYFDYVEWDDSGKPSNCDRFMDPDDLSSKLVMKLEWTSKWKIQHGPSGDAGYKITVSKAL